MTIYASPTTIWYHITASINENKIKDINIRFVNFVILALLKKSFRYLCHCDTFCLFKYYSDWWSNCEFICNNSITIWECQKRYHFRDNEYETTGINVSPRRHMTCVEFILHKCDKMGFISMKRSRLQGKFDRILILWIRNDFIEIFGVKYNLAL